jgi:hypothetical protein
MKAFRFRVAGLIAAFLVACLALSASAVDQVIFKDGFSITGLRYQEKESISDSGHTYYLPKIRGFNIVETGPKCIIYSNNVQQVGKVLENVRGEGDFTNYQRECPIGKGPLPSLANAKYGEFNDRWIRIIHVDLPGKNFAKIEQRIHFMGPSRIAMPSANYYWGPYYDTREFPPELVRKLLSTHPDLQEKPGEPDAKKRLDIAQFMKDAGWLDVALKEISDAKTSATPRPRFPPRGPRNRANAPRN